MQHLRLEHVRARIYDTDDYDAVDAVDAIDDVALNAILVDAFNA